MFTQNFGANTAHRRFQAIPPSPNSQFWPTATIRGDTFTYHMELFIEVLVFAATLYGIIGVVFSILFLLFGIEESDPCAENTCLLFKLLMLPGLVIFWPLFAIRWIIGVKKPPQERNAHRVAAKTYHLH